MNLIKGAGERKGETGEWEGRKGDGKDAGKGKGKGRVDVDGVHSQLVVLLHRKPLARKTQILV